MLLFVSVSAKFRLQGYQRPVFFRLENCCSSTMGSVSSHMTDSTLVPEGSAGASASVETIEGMPKQEQVVQKTENITKRIQELLLSAQDGKDER